MAKFWGSIGLAQRYCHKPNRACLRHIATDSSAEFVTSDILNSLGYLRLCDLSIVHNSPKHGQFFQSVVLPTI